MAPFWNPLARLVFAVLVAALTVTATPAYAFSDPGPDPEAPVAVATDPSLEPQADAPVVAVPSVPVPVPSLPAPAPQPVARAPWSVYADRSLGYEISYPPTWLTRFGRGAPPGVRWFASDDVQAPLEMKADSIWLTVAVQAGDCRPPLGRVVSSESSPLGGQSADLLLIDPDTSVEPTWKLYVSSRNGGDCYSLLFVTLTKATRDRNMDTMRTMIGSFRFVSS